MPNDVEQKAIKFSIRHLEKQGYDVEDVSRAKGHNGYDLIAVKGRKKIKIEIKGCTRPWGIPDPYVTEFDRNRRLVADFMYVIYFLGKSKPQFCVIPRHTFKPSDIKSKKGYRIRSGFKSEKNLKKFIFTG